MFWGWDLQGSTPDVQNTFKTILPIKNNVICWRKHKQFRFFYSAETALAMQNKWVIKMVIIIQMSNHLVDY